MLRKSTVAMAMLACFATSASAATVFQAENGDYLQVFGEVGVGGYLGVKEKFKQYHSEDSYIDDTFATLGAKGKVSVFDYRLELDYERENWDGGSGDMVLHIDKAWLGYQFDEHNYVEFGLTDTAFDDYDAYGDLTFDTGAETNEAGDQSKTIKYEGTYDVFKVGVSFSYKGESSSGADYGNVTNGYIGYFGEDLSVVLGAERRNGSAGTSKYGATRIYGLGLRYNITSDLLLGVNGYIERMDLGECTVMLDPSRPWEEPASSCNRYEEHKNKAGLVGLQYSINERWDVVGTINYEQLDKWDRDGKVWDGNQEAWDARGKSRTFQTIGVRYKPSRSSVIEVEGNIGDTYQDAYAKVKVFF